MSTVTRIVRASPERVWEVLADGWTYPLFVVGATRMRDVDEEWPEVDSAIHHSVGLWPLVINDSTLVTHVEPGKVLGLRARAWPLGEADIEFRIAPHADGTEVTIEEDIASGPGALIPPPLKGLSLTWRNIETLRRFAFVAENGRAPLASEQTGSWT